MCGIVGFVGPGELSDLRRMNDAIRHRGPDDSGELVWPEWNLHLAMRRLEILDIENGRQPMWDREERVAIVYNGEIYNHAELRAELETLGHGFSSDHSDTEVVLVGYRQWGADLLPRLNGMWSFCIFDRSRRELFLARDRFGQKPLYYSHRGEQFAFASELKALTRHRRIRPSLDPDSIAKLPAGHWMRLDLDSGRVDLKPYWRYRTQPFTRVPKRPWDTWGEELRRLLQRSVKRRLVADVDVGVFLSGGIDSSTVTALAAQERDNLATFAIGFDRKSFDESDWARRVADHLGTRHHSETLNDETLLRTVDVIATGLDEPFGDQSILPTYRVNQLAARHVKVALGGDGADELLAGYDPFVALAPSRLYRRLVPGPMHRAVRAILARVRPTHGHVSFEFKLKRTLRGLDFPPGLWLPTWMGSLEPREIQQLLDVPRSSEELYSEAIEAWDRVESSDLVEKTIDFYVNFYLQDSILTKIDRASMLNSLEVRSPFLDIELVDFLRRVPVRFKIGRFQRKRLLKHAVRDLLPGAVIDRTKKGFGAPVGFWFQSGSLGFEPEPGLALNWDFARRLMAQHRSGRHDHRTGLWNIWMAEAWWRKLSEVKAV